MTIYIKQGGSYAEPADIFAKTGGVYGAISDVFAKVAGAYGSVYGGGAEVAPEPIGIMAASQPPVAIYSLRRVNPAYAGPCLQARDSTNTLRTFNFDANGEIDMTPASGWGDGVTFTISLWYDQSGAARNLTSASRPKLLLNAITTASGRLLPGVDFDSKNMNMVTSATFMDIGGTSNLAVAVVAGTYGWSSAGAHVRNPAVYSNANGPMIGTGTGSGNSLLFGALQASGETAIYGKEGELYLEEGTPTNTRIRNLWFNQIGANVTGGADVRKLFTARPHGVAGLAAARLVVGNRGDLQQSHNGPIFEVVVYESGAPMTNNEVWAVSIGQRQFWGNLAAANRPTRYYGIASGQSLMQYMGTVASASTLSVGDVASTRVFSPTALSLIGATGTLRSSFTNTAIGGSSILKTSGASTPDGPGGTSWLAWDGVSSATKFWWDQFNELPGPVLVSVLAQLPTYVGAQYANTAILWDQGQAEAVYFTASGESGTLTVANWVAKTKVVWAQLRAALGSATIPIYVQPLGRQTGADAYMRTLRLAQNQFAADDTTVKIGVSTHDLTRQDTVHLGAGPADPNGFDAAATRLARGFVGQFNSAIKYDAPFVSGATVSGASTVDVAIAWPTAGSGTDITPSSGIVGFTVSDAGGARTVSAAVRQTATSVRLTVSGGALVAPVTVTHNPQVSALDRTLMLRDNIGLPLDPSPAITAS